MTVIVAQQNITQTLTLNQFQLLALLSGFTIAPAVSSYINVFQKATISYRFGTAVFTNTNNVLSFKLGSTVVSNSLNATNILGLPQSTSISFAPANPYSGSMASSANTALTFNIDTANILGGDATSSLSITFTYSVFAA